MDRITLIRYPQDRFNITRGLLSPFLILIPFVYLPSSTFATFAVWSLLWLELSKSNFVLHNHIHHPMARSKPLNRLLESTLGFCTGMGAGIWRLTHVHGHHIEHLSEKLPSRKRFILQSDQELESFTLGKMFKFSSSGYIRLWFGTLRHCFRKGYTRAIDGKPYFGNAYYRHYFKDMALHISVVFILTIYKPYVAFLFLWLPYLLVYFFSRYIDFLNHVGTKALGSIANNCLNSRYNHQFWNFGYHTAHHAHPKAHWSELPTLHRLLEDRIPEAAIKSYHWSGFLFLYHWLQERKEMKPLEYSIQMMKSKGREFVRFLQWR